MFRPHGSCTYSFIISLRRCLSAKVPGKPTWMSSDKCRFNLPKEPNIDKEIVDLLERLSLVQFNNLEAVDRLNKAVQSANQLNAVNTDNVEPIDSVLEDRKLYLREDTVMDGNCLNDILKNASKTIEDYYVAPPGNIPLKQKDRDYGNDYSTNQ
ncbi:glutamyl-tRNA(Gln) amidotransferase subunit C, mitochondrial-like [Saccostrea echinata]|uniref:glutamyl-tRNA(Gln) amidotransferase subunit C, mitochondrial-like n=1 Tax=Saccostrea echinata TaxID=191078 RepID=UPI002A807D67|nr:glutamyl-tRNA(Gln) amidotransferase subunit C, mitochondrial-like [Saccostrea echinata]